MTEQELIEELKDHCRSMITCSHYNNLDDKEFDLRIKGILVPFKEAGWKSPEEIALMYNPDYLDFQKGVEATRELYKGYVKLAGDQTTLPEPGLDNHTAIVMFKAGWRKVEVKE